MAFKTVCQNNKCSVIITIIIIIKTVINCHRPVFSSCTVHSFLMHLDLLPGFGGLHYLPPSPPMQACLHSLATQCLRGLVLLCLPGFGVSYCSPLPTCLHLSLCPSHCLHSLLPLLFPSCPSVVLLADHVLAPYLVLS